MYPASCFHFVVSFGVHCTLLNMASVCLLTRLASPRAEALEGWLALALGLGLGLGLALGLVDADALGEVVLVAVGLALELAAGTILAEVEAVLVALADGDGVAFAVELELAEGLVLGDALGEAAADDDELLAPV